MGDFHRAVVIGHLISPQRPLRFYGFVYRDGRKYRCETLWQRRERNGKGCWACETSQRVSQSPVQRSAGAHTHAFYLIHLLSKRPIVLMELVSLFQLFAILSKRWAHAQGLLLTLGPSAGITLRTSGSYVIQALRFTSQRSCRTNTFVGRKGQVFQIPAAADGEESEVPADSLSLSLIYDSRID